MLLDVIIVDDEPTARRTLRECCAREPDLRILGEYGDSRVRSRRSGRSRLTCCSWTFRSIRSTAWRWRGRWIRQRCR